MISRDQQVGQYQQSPVETPIEEHLLIETLLPGEKAKAHRMQWDTNLQRTVKSSIVDTIYDRHPLTPAGVKYGRNFGVAGEVFRTQRNTASGRYEVLGECGLRRWGLVKEDESPNTITGYASPIDVDILKSAEPSCFGEASGVIVNCCYTSQPRKLKKDDRVLVHYHPDMKKWFLLYFAGQKNDAPPEIIRFLLTEDKDFNAAASAVRLDLTQQPVGGPITVIDTVGDWGNGKANVTEGWAVHLPDNQDPNLYEIIFMEGPARYIEFELTGYYAEKGFAFTDGKARAQIFRNGTADWGLTDNGLQLNLGAGAPSVDVYDEMGMYKRALVGARGLAVLDEQTPDDEVPQRGRYRVVVCQQMSPFFKAKVKEKMCGDKTQIEIDPETITDLLMSPFNQNPSPVLAAAVGFENIVFNEMGCAVKDGEHIDCRWSEGATQFKVKFADHFEVEVVLPGSPSPGQTGCVPPALQKLKIWTMRCENPEDYSFLELEEKAIITGFRKEATECAPEGGSGSGSGYINPGTCKVVADLERICVIKRTPVEGEEAPEPLDVVEGTPMEVTVATYFANGCEYSLMQWMYSLCAPCDGNVVKNWCGKKCPPASGSGSGSGS